MDYPQPLTESQQWFEYYRRVLFTQLDSDLESTYHDGRPCFPFDSPNEYLAAFVTLLRVCDKQLHPEGIASFDEYMSELKEYAKPEPELEL
jgi:hypothetical protein